MRHRKAGKKLGRNPSHRLALYRNLAMALFRHERIITTVAKAKAVRPFVEKLITLAKKNTLHARRLVIARMGPASQAEVVPGDGDKADHRTVVQKLFSDLAPRFTERPGGYTRIIKRHQWRLGDAGDTAFLELLKEGETKHRGKAPSAPRVADDETPAQETPKETAATEQAADASATSEQAPAPAEGEKKPDAPAG